jgi:hypothetical protein
MTDHLVASSTLTTATFLSQTRNISKVGNIGSSVYFTAPLQDGQ